MSWKFFQFEARVAFGERFDRATRQQQDEMIAFVTAKFDLLRGGSNGRPQ